MAIANQRHFFKLNLPIGRGPRERPPSVDNFYRTRPSTAVGSTVGVCIRDIRKSELSSKNSAVFVDCPASIDVKTRLKPVYFENQKQCAAALSLDVRQLKEWKTEGCPAFRFSRIYHAELLDWIKKKKKDIRAEESAADPEQTEPPRSHWDRERARVEYERAKFNLEIEKRKYVELDEILAAIGQLLAGFMSAMRMFPGSAARWLVGAREFHQIKAKLEAEVDTILASLNRCKYLEDRKTFQRPHAGMATGPRKIPRGAHDRARQRMLSRTADRSR
jgi:phage terminase Nu1 subunit (DNA packaging protein)